MRIVWLNEDLTEAVVRRRTFPIFGTYIEAVVKRVNGYWNFASGDAVPTGYRSGMAGRLEEAREEEEERRAAVPAQHDRNWRPVFQPQTRLPPARLVQK